MPDYISNFFIRVVADKRLRSSSKNLLLVPRTVFYEGWRLFPLYRRNLTNSYKMHPCLCGMRSMCQHSITHQGMLIQYDSSIPLL